MVKNHRKVSQSNRDKKFKNNHTATIESTNTPLVKVEKTNQKKKIANDGTSFGTHLSGDFLQKDILGR